jgi:cell fate (sporulation/competence/biofilm development) regulator YlbF (YheA/YmcA/DUF963 family)
MSILEKAKDLAEAIADSQEVSQVKEAEMKMYQNSEAVAILEEVAKKQEELRNLQMLGKEITQEQIEELYKLQEDAEAMEDVQNYVQAQNKLNQLMQTVNLIIEQAISGNDGCSGNCSSGCGGGCC